MWSTITSWAYMYCVELRGSPIDWNNIIFQIQAAFTCCANIELGKKRRYDDRHVSYASEAFPSKHPTACTGSVLREKSSGSFYFPSAYLILFCTIWLTSKLAHTLHFEERTNHRRLFKIICFFYSRLHRQGIFKPRWLFILKSAYSIAGDGSVWGRDLGTPGGVFYLFRLFLFYSKVSRGGGILSGR